MSYQKQLVEKNLRFFAYKICLMFKHKQIAMLVGMTMVKNVHLYEFSYIIRYFPLHPTRKKTFAVHKYLLITIHKRSNVGLFCLFSLCKLGHSDFINLLSTVYVEAKKVVHELFKTILICFLAKLLRHGYDFC
jgi:hypothetical protein